MAIKLKKGVKLRPGIKIKSSATLPEQPKPFQKRKRPVDSTFLVMRKTKRA